MSSRFKGKAEGEAIGAAAADTKHVEEMRDKGDADGLREDTLKRTE